MQSTAEINAIVNKAKQNRADFIANSVHSGILPVALVAFVALTLFVFSSGPTQDQAQPNTVAETTVEVG